jgi:hypothetical protein|tara:strand:+ start:2427 stop:2810 length:384 start_codon:yes stop_codon:yes gene_type:complete
VVNKVINENMFYSFMKKNKISKTNYDGELILEESDITVPKLFERTYDSNGSYLGVFLGITDEMHVHHSGEGNFFNLSEQDVIDKLVEDTWFEEGELCVKLSHVHETCTKYCLDKYHTYQVYGVKKDD